MTLSITTFNIKGLYVTFQHKRLSVSAIMLNAFMLSVTFDLLHGECLYVECRCAECPGASLKASIKLTTLSNFLGLH
jgi:hypothetical protein